MKNKKDEIEIHLSLSGKAIPEVQNPLSKNGDNLNAISEESLQEKKNEDAEMKCEVRETFLFAIYENYVEK